VGVAPYSGETGETIQENIGITSGRNKKKRRSAESQAPLLKQNQSFPYLKDHLLLGTECRLWDFKTVRSNLQQNPTGGGDPFEDNAAPSIPNSAGWMGFYKTILPSVAFDLLDAASRVFL
jgi:hypothetical protein